MRLEVDGYSTVTELVGRAVRTDLSMVPAPHDALSVVAAPGDPADVRTLVLRIPGAEVGGLVEYRYQRLYRDPDFVPVWLLGGPLPVVRAELGIVARDGIRVDYRYGRGNDLVDRLPLRRRLGDGSERLVFVETNLAAYYPEPDMPHPARLAPWIALTMTRAKVGDSPRKLETWDDVSGRTRSLFAAVGGEPLAGSAPERFALVRDALKGIRRDGAGVRPPSTAKKLIGGEAACSRDAAAYLLTALAKSGAKAYPALLTAHSGPPAVEGFPGFYPFVRVVVALDVRDEVAKDPSCRADPGRRGLLCTVPQDSYAFLDPLCSGCRFGELPTELTGGRALVLLDQGPRWVDVPADPPERNRVMVQMQLSLGVDGKLTGELNGETTGGPARRLRQSLTQSERGEARDEALQAQLFGDPAAVHLRRGTYANPTRIDKPLSFRSQAEGAADKRGYEHYEVSAVGLAGASFPGRWRSHRRWPLVLSAPLWSEVAVAVELPVGYQVTPPPITRIVEPFAEYAAGYARRERTLSYSRRLIVKKQVISAADYPAFRRFIEEVSAVEAAPLAVR
ncbi:MAG: DUF3858 domain-containing protein, partial [Deltaproteobacteria bacterium]|nr:DUF3858 domain-containing protein [Deltaproteobacteria bacterium]